MKKFKQLLSAADAVDDTGDYVAGYRRGLRRAHHGDDFGTAGEHQQWLYAGGDREAGYRDGLAFALPRALREPNRG